MTRRLVVIESPYGSRPDGSRASPAEIRVNVEYLDACLLDSLRRGEQPFASHGLYTRALRDSNPQERRIGMEAGFAWGELAQVRVFYVDRGWTSGMEEGRQEAIRLGQRTEVRRLWGVETLTDSEKTQWRARVAGMERWDAREWLRAHMPKAQYQAWMREPFSFGSESPIENILAHALLDIATDQKVPDVWEDQVLLLAFRDEWFRLETQVRVPPYRLDMVLSNETGDVLIDIEADGAPYHSSPEQVARDRKRDREMSARGYRVLRYTGSEITRDASGCAHEIARIASLMAGG